MSQTMHKFLIGALLAGVISAQTFNCYIYSNEEFFDLSSLARQEDFSVTSLDQLYTFTFNFCVTASNVCQTKLSSYAYRQSLTDCLALTNDDWNPADSKVDKQKKDDTTELIYTLAGGEVCDGDESTITFAITCDEDVQGDPFFMLDSSDPCNPVVEFAHASGCPSLDFAAYNAFIEENPYLVGAALIVIGLIMAFKGRKLIPWVVGCVSGGATFVLLLMLFQWLGFLDYFIVGEEGDFFTALAALLIAGLIGVGIGYYFMTRLLFWGFAIVGAVGGFILGTIVYSLFMVYWSDSLFVYWGTLIVCAIIGGAIAVWLSDSVIILCTSFIGSYGFFRGISMFLGGFPTEVEMQNMIKTGTAEFSTSFLLYLIGIALMTIGCIVYQYKVKAGDKDDDKYRVSK